MEDVCPESGSRESDCSSLLVPPIEKRCLTSFRAALTHQLVRTTTPLVIGLSAARSIDPSTALKSWNSLGRQRQGRDTTEGSETPFYCPHRNRKGDPSGMANLRTGCSARLELPLNAPASATSPTLTHWHTPSCMPQKENRSKKMNHDQDFFLRMFIGSCRILFIGEYSLLSLGD